MSNENEAVTLEVLYPTTVELEVEDVPQVVAEVQNVEVEINPVIMENVTVSATTKAEGTNADVTKSVNDGIVHLEFGIPRGNTGSTGAKGDKGDKGDTGEKGDKGDKGDAGTTEWSGITGKPETFPPSAHTHDERYYTEAEVNAILENYVPKGLPLYPSNGGN